MKKFLAYGALALLVIIVLAAAIVQIRFSLLASKIYSRPNFSIAEEMKTADVELGKRIFNVRSGCVDCHGANLTGTTFTNDPAIGKLSAANLTPSNLKSWSDDEIAHAIRYGIHKTGRSLRAMPSMEYTGLSKSDLAAVVAYLRTVPANDQKMPEPSFGPIGKILTITGQMPFALPAMVIPADAPVTVKPEEKPTLEFGKYLVNSCTGCHGSELRGGPIQGGDPAWPPAANIRMGANPVWTLESFKKTLETGISPVSGKELRPPMPVYLLKQYNETEVTAVWTYLSTLK